MERFENQRESFLRSLFDVPTDPSLLRLIGELLLLGSAASWALLALGLWIAELYGAPPLPVFESILGVAALLGGWRFIPRSWPASVPILFQATVVYLFIAAIVASGADPDFAVVWIVIWSATATCVTTLALGFVTSVSLVISGTLLLNILIGWLYPSSSGLLVPSMIGLAGSAVIGIITHAVCFLMTQANSEVRQLDRIRIALTEAFARELDLPIAATEQTAINVGIQSPEAAMLWVLRSHLTEIRRLLLSSESAEAKAPVSERSAITHVLMAATSLVARIAEHRHIEITHTFTEAEARLVSMPARDATAILAFFCREAVLQPNVEALQLSVNIENTDTATPMATFRLIASHAGEARAIKGRMSTEKKPALALSHIRQRVDKLGGELEIRPQFGQWREIELQLPVALHDLSLDLSSHAHSDSISYGNARLLLIEDEELTRLLTARNLERHGAQVTQAADAKEALALLESGEFDAIVADLNLPDLSGTELIMALRNYDAVIPIVVVTATAGKLNIDELVAAGADQLLAKPLQGDELAHAIGLLRAAGRWG
ncbi:MAG: response regulator [Halieaceae bacterium]|jgi:CheY-like chemotaxis protein|nr:response regulator [Halieaceae bacterium]